MSVRGKPAIPATPRVISPSPTPSELQDDAYNGPVTRSAARRRQVTRGVSSPSIPFHETIDEDSDPELRRARARSRSPIKSRKVPGFTPAATPARAKSTRLAKKKALDVVPSEQEEGLSNGAAAVPGEETEELSNGAAAVTTNGHLAPPKSPATPGWSWRDFSRSPSPLGLIPIHRHFRNFVHKHEVPRKVLHVSIGFFVYWLYVSGTQTTSVTPWLMAALVPIATTDYLRLTYPSLNRFYVKCLGAFMRETEYAGVNGVVYYLLGAWIVLYFFPKDVAVVSVMLLSWCDTAASTFGRLYGRYTPRIRRGKSFAGSFAAFLIGVATAAWFWGWVAPNTPSFPDEQQSLFMFRGVLRLPAYVAELVGLDEQQATVSGGVALGIMSLWSGLVAAGSEVIDLFGWDDNLTIPVLSGIGMWGFLRVFG
ncbi:phosphatidate cytidylyltransferase [Apiospora marii]|uniref:phosphatidate cytidylyltransferase n=1 Tax=Apiospora marii TaxID=335849 RepID=UPI00312DD32C